MKTNSKRKPAGGPAFEHTIFPLVAEHSDATVRKWGLATGCRARLPSPSIVGKLFGQRYRRLPS